ncbi:MAG TPA: branched chain amino acid aminotransferase, partial [Rhodanobacter sp.]
ITPVRSVDRKVVGIGAPGPITRQLQQAFFGLFDGRTEDRWNWLSYVSAVIPDHEPVPAGDRAHGRAHEMMEASA